MQQINRLNVKQGDFGILWDCTTFSKRAQTQVVLMMKATPPACYIILQGNSRRSVFVFSATDAAMFLLFDSYLCRSHQQNSNKQFLEHPSRSS